VSTPAVDVHQHLWPEAFFAALARRERPPRLRGSTLELAAEPAGEIDFAAHDLDARLRLLDVSEIDVAIVSLQPTLGIADLPGEERAELVTIYESGIRELAAAANGRIVPLGAGGPELEGFAGACVAAPALLDLDGIAALLDELERRGGFLFVHPGPPRSPLLPVAWWPGVVDYTAQMQAAYAAWLAEGVERWTSLRVVFAILAGGGPFQLERLRSHGVSGRDLVHDNVFLETASYGRRALDLCLATYGVDPLLYGSDTPVIDPEPTLDAVRGFGDAVADALCRQNPTRLLS
jgi:6-methylsalicylate decarboxylase